MDSDPTVIIPAPLTVYAPMSREMADRFRVWSDPVQIMVEPDETNPLLVKVTMRTVRETG